MSDKIERPPLDADALTDLCNHLAAGNSLRSWSAKMLRDPSTVHEWIMKDETREAEYRKARRMQADTHIDSLIELADEPVPTDDFGRTDSGAVQRLRVRIDTRKWVAAKFYPALYGEKIEVGGNLGVDVSAMKPADIMQKIAGLFAAHGLAVVPIAKPPEEG